MDGWESRRRRDSGHDRVLVALDCPGEIEEVEVNTAHNKGNCPDRCALRGALVKNPHDQALVTQAMFWPEILPETILQADAIHRFDAGQLETNGPISHVRLSIFPGGVFVNARAAASPTGAKLWRHLPTSSLSL